MPELSKFLEIDRCPHCGVALPLMEAEAGFPTRRQISGAPQMWWAFYVCSSCAFVVMAYSKREGGPIERIFPAPPSVDEAIPSTPREYLAQAQASLSQPAGAVMLAASAVDAMLKAKGLSAGNLNSRIESAASKHLITDGMKEWAHDIRLDANDQRHADDDATLPTQEDARRSVEFALALAEFLFVLPNRVTRGSLNEARGNAVPAGKTRS